MHTRLFQYHEIEAGDVLESIKVSFLKVLGKLSYLLEQIVDIHCCSKDWGQYVYYTFVQQGCI